MARGARPILYGPRAGLVIGTWPGQLGNPVGFAATPALQPQVWPGGTWPGAWPGSYNNATTATVNGSTVGGLSTPCSLNQLAIALGGTIPNGSAGNPTIIAFFDFDAQASSNPITSTGLDSATLLHDATFIGCRFQSSGFSSDSNVECWKSGSYNIAFLYCSMTPRRTAGPHFSKTNSPAVLDVTNPGSWPSASVGTGLQDGGGGVAIIGDGTNGGTYQTPFLSGNTACLSIGTTGGTYMTVDHCDMWGSGFGIKGTAVFPLGSPVASTTPHSITDNWMHDNRFPYPPYWDPAFPYLTGAYVRATNNAHIYQALSGTTGVDPTTDGGVHWSDVQNSGDHGESIGFAQGTQPPPQNWTIRHNTLATLGNTGVFVWQSTASNYVNIHMINNYMSGTQSVIDPGTLASGSANNNWAFTDNIFATDLDWFNATLDHVGSPQPMQAQFTQTNGNNNVWRRNKLKIYPGDNWSGFAASDGQFVLPGTPSVANNFSTTDWNL